MAYKRNNNDSEGRVVGFRDGQPIYKRANRQNDERGGNERGGRRFNDRDRDGKRDGADAYSGSRTYNRKGQPSGGGSPRREDGFRRDDNGYSRDDGFRRNEGGYRREGQSYRRYEEGEVRRGGYRKDRPAERDGFRPFREESAPDFGDERLNRKSQELYRGPKPRDERRYDNLKPLPRDIPEQPREDEELPNIIMGRNPVKEAIKAGRSIDRILVTKEHDGSLNEILDLARDAKLVVRDVDRSKLDEICMPFGHNGRTGNHQGIIAYIPGVEYCEISDILAYAKEKDEDPFVILLDGIEDPHNLGSIIRSAECAGAHGVVITKRRSASVTAAVVKTSAGATEHMRIAKVVNLAVAIERLKEAGVWVAGADMGGEPMYKADLKGPFALVVGAEGAGISRLVKEKCDYIVSVPLRGEIGSLNASVAAAVIMFEKVRQERS
ncbi:MAG: 23S rRNA (guanosine(2251)-2'-O)-methyltransferase RlmB [Clostridiales bacterium]|nr:23S rRNA (guanosine(2251)-2'-O)-methyltransferase RlmB [Clostridiales bacterium]